MQPNHVAATVIGLLVVLGLAAAVVFYFWWLRRQHQPDAPPLPPPPVEEADLELDEMQANLQKINNPLPNVPSNPLCVGKFLPFAKYKFPSKWSTLEPAVLGSLPFLCYPDLNRAKPQRPDDFEDETFVLTITDRSGDRKFAHCCRFVPLLTSSDFAAPGQKDENSVIIPSLPQVLCLVTPVQAMQFYTDLVRQCACWLKSYYHLDALDDFLSKIFNETFPMPGQKLTVEVPLNCRLEKRIQITNSLLSERRVLIIGDNVACVSKVIQAAATMLDPFEWPHTLIPVVPDSYVQLCFSPTPYLIGVLRCNLHELKHLLVNDGRSEDEEYILIYDLDYGVIKERDYNGRSIADSTGLPSTDSSYRFLPSRAARNLRSALKSSFANRSDRLPYNSSYDNRKDRRKSDNNPNGGNFNYDVIVCKRACRFVVASDAKIADAFLHCFVQLVGHYRDFIVQQQDGRYTFQKEQFVRSNQHGSGSTKSHRTFLKWFVETGMFQVWMKKRLEGLNCGGGVNLKNFQRQNWDALDEKVYELKNLNKSKSGGSSSGSKVDLIAKVAKR